MLLKSNKLKIILITSQGGTGYAAVNNCLEGKHERPVLQA